MVQRDWSWEIIHQCLFMLNQILSISFYDELKALDMYAKHSVAYV